MSEPEVRAGGGTHRLGTSENTLPADAGLETSGCLAVRPGQSCPVCGEGILNYNGLLILSCAICGFKELGGGFT